MVRRLAAILAADVVGYTRLMGADEAGTLARLTGLRQAILEPLINQHHGRIVKLMGDGLLVEFASAVDSVACAVAWQDKVARNEAEFDAGKALQFRIGINLGDVIAEDGDIHGDGVNIASRLEALAQPGGICLSDDVYRHTRGKLEAQLEAQFKDTGEHKLKNVADPVRVYSVSAGRSVAPAQLPKTVDLSFPVRPSVAVLPFKDLARDSTLTDFGDGLAADIITELSRSGTISVIGRHESQSPALEGASLKDIGQTLSVRYVLSGTIRSAGGRGRITAELLEVSTGNSRWTERYDRSLDDPFAVQDEIARAIAGIVEPSLHRAEIDRISRSPAKDLQPHELMLRAWRLSDKGNKQDNQAAKRDCEGAITLDPQYSDAYSQLAWIFWFEALSGWTDDPRDSLSSALGCAERALSLNPKDYDALGGRGAALIGLGRYDAAARVAEDLARKFPDHAHSTMYRGECLTSLGRHKEALELIEHSMEINPEHDQWPWMYLGICLFCLERFEEAIDALEQFKALSKLPVARIVLAAACAAAGRDEEARTEAASLEGEAQKLTAVASLIFRDAADRERLNRWAQRAGLPE